MGNSTLVKPCDNFLFIAGFAQAEIIQFAIAWQEEIRVIKNIFKGLRHFADL
ncbi:Uncharacterised protein [Salmonella enterica subsp. enterica serovar Bovismorbificans]|uniref:Uncharacterized protein n=1 Tax=Salmonella enterica subsp. enterica serovar Bovismorbificans TaxID=58097 RepID=A0A655EH38_SALET|nr:Uncharacterised protein [Salmonella enterica subsp. enterica serovar Bovismorbificans]